MDTLKLDFVVITLLCLGSLSNGQFTERPKNVAAVRDTVVTFTCESGVTPNTVHIFWMLSNDTDFTTVAFDNTVVGEFDRYTVVYVERTETGTSRSVLTLTGVLPKDAGTYKCEGTPSGKTYAQLVVFGSNPQVVPNTTMNEVIEGETIGLSCFVPYYSAINWAPTIIWREIKIGPLPMIDQSTANEARFVYSSTTHRNHTGRQFECAVEFGTIPVENIPVLFRGDHNMDPLSYSFASRTLFLTVYYPVENLHLTDPKEVYNPGERLTITAMGRPGPSFSWQNFFGNTTVDGNILTVTAAMEGIQNWTYIAYNTIRNESYEIAGNHSFIVKILPTTTTTTTQATTTTPVIPTTENGNTGGGAGGLSGGAIAGIVFGSLVGLALIILVIFCCISKNKAPKTKGGQNDIPGPVLGGVFMDRKIRTQRKNQPSAPMHDLRLVENSTIPDEPYCDIKDEDLDKNQVYYNENGNFGPQSENIFLGNGTLVSPTSSQQVPSLVPSDDLYELPLEPEHEYTPLERIQRQRE